MLQAGIWRESCSKILPPVIRRKTACNFVFFLLSTGVKRCDMSSSSSCPRVLVSSQPLWTTLLAFAILGERLSGAGIVGGALIVGAALLSSGE